MSKGNRLPTVSSIFKVGVAEFFLRWCYVLSSQLHTAKYFINSEKCSVSVSIHTGRFTPLLILWLKDSFDVQTSV